jgi:hypothetical protein
VHFIASGVWPTMPRPFLSFLSLFTNVVEEEFSELRLYRGLGSVPSLVAVQRANPHQPGAGVSPLGSARPGS